MKFLPLAISTLGLLAASTSTSAQDVPPVLQVHGSGTTNPSKCYWHIMDQMEEQLKLPAKLSYRGVGSSTGQEEFIGNVQTPVNDFGSGDIPIDSANFVTLKNAGIEIVHLPVVLGAISFFHSVPVEKLNISACLLAKILNRKVTNWNDDLVVAENTGIRSMLPGGSLAINVARRGLGSSSTSSITEYLNVACPEEWPLEKVGKKPEEVGWADDTEVCEGSSGMTACIRRTPGTIGYIDAGHGHAQGLQEIELKNADGNFLTSKVANENNGIAQAALAEGAGLPDSLDEDFGNVKLLNKPGQYTWPIVAMSYIYVRKDLPSFIPEPANQQLLKAFLEALYRPEYINDCDELFSFTPVAEELRTKALSAISDMLQSNATAELKFVFETETDPVGGQGDFVISQKRDTYAAVEQRMIVSQLDALSSVSGGSADLADTISQLQASNTALKATVNELREDLDELRNIVNNGGSSPGRGISATSEHEHEFTDDDETKLEAALALACISFVFWCVAIILGLAKICGLF